MVQGRRRFVVAWEDRREHDYGWGIFGVRFGRPGADQAFSYCGTLHDFDRSGTGSWCVQAHLAINSAFSRGIQRNADESRGAAVGS